MASQAPNNDLASSLGKLGGFSAGADNSMYKYIQEAILKAQALNPSELNFSPSDTILCSYPKTGTTWLKALAFAISTRTRSDPTRLKTHPLLSTNPHDLIPFLEFEIAQSKKPRNSNVPLVSTHIPYKMLPESVLDSGCKIVYISRNPKDVLVSAYHFVQKIPNLDRGSPFSLELAFERFCDGSITPYGDYWEHRVLRGESGTTPKSFVLEIRGYDQRWICICDEPSQVYGLSFFEPRREGRCARNDWGNVYLSEFE